MWIWSKHAWEHSLSEEAAREKAIDEAVHDASLMVQGIAEGVFFCARNGLILEVNRAFTDLLGYERSDVVGQTLGFWLHMTFNQDLYSNLKSALEGAGRWCGGVWISPVSGKVFYALLTLNAVRDHGGSLMYFSGVIGLADRLAANKGS